MELGIRKVGAVGFCYGGWAVFHLAAQGETLSVILVTNIISLVMNVNTSLGNNLVDCISTSHPSLLDTAEIDAVSVPVQICAPEIDPEFRQELKDYANKVIPQLDVGYDYQYFPGLSHGFATRGDQNDPRERKGLERAKNATVCWLKEHLVS